jgi:hypothetical protein
VTYGHWQALVFVAACALVGAVIGTVVAARTQGGWCWRCYRWTYGCWHP